MLRATEETPNDDGRLDGDNWRTDWFAEQLGDRWQTSGDGIYTYTPDEPRSGSDYMTSSRFVVAPLRDHPVTRRPESFGTPGD